jgi:hypothetical protein
MSDTVRVYVNAQPIDVANTATVLDAVEAFDATCAAEVRSGERNITDSRGIITANNGSVHNGAIYRIVRARHGAPEDNDLAQL